ncbi:hypothetical protein GCM10008941_30510 [Rhizomicrobium palustre]
MPPDASRAVTAQVVVAEVMGVEFTDLCAEIRGGRDAAFARQVAMYLCRLVYEMPLSEIAECFGRDRSTVGHAVQRIEDAREDAEFDEAMAWLEHVVGRLGREDVPHV